MAHPLHRNKKPWNAFGADSDVSDSRLILFPDSDSLRMFFFSLQHIFYFIFENNVKISKTIGAHSIKLPQKPTQDRENDS